jgi:integrase/recombinase XerD
MRSTNLCKLLQEFFEERLIKQKGVSEHTLASYSCAFRLLFEYAYKQLNKKPGQLVLQDLNPKFINGFLNDLEEERKITPQSRNVYLNAIRSFFQYLAFKLPAFSELINAVLDIHKKRVIQRLVDFLTPLECEALLSAPNQKSWLGRRDRMLLLLALETGLRLSELTGLKWLDVNWIVKSIRCRGKGRKEREVFLSYKTMDLLKLWYQENQLKYANVFPTRCGVMSSDAFQRLVKKYTFIAKQHCPSIGVKRVTPHVLRHTAVMRALNSGIELAQIALWIGHESLRTTYRYLAADSKMKEEIINKINPLKIKTKRYKPNTDVTEYLKYFERSRRTGKEPS